MVESLLKTKIVEIPIPTEGQRPNRDAGRRYLLEEMPVLKAEKWARRAIGAMSRQDLDVREEMKKLGFLGFYLLGLQALAGGDMDAVDGLMEEMLPCIKIYESDTFARPVGADGDFWELSTVYQLRKELIELHMGFTFAELVLILMATTVSAQQTDSLDTPTSAPSSET